METRRPAGYGCFNPGLSVLALLCLPLAACGGGDGTPAPMDGSVDASPDGSSTEGGTLDGATDGSSDGATDGATLDASADGATWPDGGSPEEALARMVQLCHDWGDIVCGAQWTWGCCEPGDRMDASEAECQTRYYTGCDFLFMGAAWTDGRIHFDVAATEADLATTRSAAMACDPDARSEVTKNISGTIAAGGDCTPVDAALGPGRDNSATWACDPGLYCKVTTDAGALHGVCTNLETEGGPCTGSGECVASLHCSGSVCEAPAADGAACIIARDCAGGYCALHACTSTPHPDWCNY